MLSKLVNTRWLFLAAYTCSGMAGLIFEVAWTRLATLYMGHSTAAASTVVAAFMGGLAAGAALGGRLATRLTRRHALVGYAVMEAIVALAAIAMPRVLAAVTPLLAWAYHDGSSGVWFPIVRLLTCLLVLIVPAVALGATFPLAVRWAVASSRDAGRDGGALYAANTIGAAAGALTSAFVLIPALGVFRTTLAGAAASALAIVAVLLVARGPSAESANTIVASPSPARKAPVAEGGDRLRLAAVIVALTGLATFMYEIAWTRLFAAVIGPSTYAFSATVTGIIAGLAAGSVIGSMLAGRARRPSLPLALALGGAAIAATWASSYAGSALPRLVVEEGASGSAGFHALLMRHSIRAVLLVAPAAVGLGIAFPLALALAAPRDATIARRFGSIYAINTVTSVAGALLAGFVTIPRVGLQNTLHLASACLICGALIAASATRSAYRRARAAAMLPALAAGVMLLVNPPWDRELLASGGYKYAARVHRDVDLPTALKAGTLLYYREGASGIVSVKQLTGTLSLAIDGKVDASTGGDMLTQKTLAHLPLLLHESPKTVCIIGLGSGVTLASALVHPVTAVDIVEISPEVVEASRYFSGETHDALHDSRVRLVPGDGRSHLSLSSQRYDVIISEPSNPWMAGVASLFTREFFAAVRERLAPGGIVCQWAHTYDISDADLRSIAATFASIFPNGTMWLVGDGDLLLVGSTVAIEPHVARIETTWQRAGVADDLRGVSMRDPFALWSLFAGGAGQLEAYGAGAAMQTDDRMALEFSGPTAINTTAAAENTAALRRLLDGQARPPAIEQAVATAGARAWKDRAAMMFGASAYDASYRDSLAALTKDPTESDALAGLVRAAVAAHRESEAVQFLKATVSAQPRAVAPRVALSKLLAASGSFQEAVAVAHGASVIEPPSDDALAQLASLHADLGDAKGLSEVVDRLQRMFPQGATTRYYAAARDFLQRRLPEASRLAEQAVDLDPTRAAARNLLGAIRASLGEVERARAAFQAALRLDPRDPAAYTNLATLELSSGNRSLAVDLFAEALSLDPTSAAARQGLAHAR